MSNRDDSPAAILIFSRLTDKEILLELKKHNIGLTVEEARKVSEMLGRDPSITEATIWGIQGSEHCSYKSSKRFLREFPAESSRVILGPGEDSGIVAITDGPKGKRWGLVISHESHNHPSQIVPYEGAATGIGGVVRDVVCMGARVIGCMDFLRFGDLKTEESKVIASEVAGGISGYGNPLGIPNLGGDTVFDSSYNSNCLVNAVALGIVREDEIIHSTVPQEAAEKGYDIIIVGKPTDRSGFGGASFASASMDEEENEKNTGAVQEPNPFLERHLLASTYALFDWLAANRKLDKVSFKDLGAGGVVCASVEQVSGRDFGASIDLDKVHVSVDGLPPEVIACAETQERFCWICHPELTSHILAHYNIDWDLPSVAEKARASVIGKVDTSGIYKLKYNGEIVCNAKAMDITCGLSYNRTIEPTKTRFKEPEISHAGGTISISKPATNPLRQAAADYAGQDNQKPITSIEWNASIIDVFQALISHPNYASTAPITVHYDKNIIGNTIIEAGEADAGVIAPLKDLPSLVHQGEHPGWEIPESHKHIGVAVAGDGNGRYGRISPFLQGLNAAAESMRNVAAIGASPRALTDCLNYGNPEIPEQMWELAEGVRGIAHAAASVRVDGECVPVISGNVSLYNGQPDGSSIDPTAIVCCIGVIPDVKKAINMRIKKNDSSLFLIGERKDECGGSAYYQILEEMSGAPQNSLIGKSAPEPDMKELSQEIAFVTNAINNGLLLSCHDISNGGLALSLFEMTAPQRNIGGNIGVDIDIEMSGSLLRPDIILFSETGGFICEIAPDKEKEFLGLAKKPGVRPFRIGRTTRSPTMLIRKSDEVLLDIKLMAVRLIWENALKKAIKS